MNSIAFYRRLVGLTQKELTCAVNSGHQTIRQLPTLSSEL